MRRRQLGFTIVELLVVIAIIGILVALMMPAIQSARESARQNGCQSNLKQLGQASQQHIDSFGRYPSNGWGWSWVGDPDCGTGPGQPGGWIFNLLPYIDQQTLHDLGGGGTATEKQNASATRVTTMLPLLNCPTRRRSSPAPLSTSSSSYPYLTAATTAPMARSDYGINEGDGSSPEYSNYANNCQIGAGPGVPASGDARQVSVTWFNTSPPATAPNALAVAWTGVSFIQSMILPAQVTDGSGYVLLIGEKSLNPNYYYTGQDPDDNENMYVGIDNDTGRIGGTSFPITVDTPGVSNACSFGSAHTNGVYFAFCDGSSRVLRYGIDPTLLGYLANRSDGAPIDDASLK